MPRSPHASTIGADLGGKDGATHESSGGSEDDEDEILEVSENGRWQKIKQPVRKYSRGATFVTQTRAYIYQCIADVVTSSGR